LKHTCKNNQLTHTKFISEPRSGDIMVETIIKCFQPPAASRRNYGRIKINRKWSNQPHSGGIIFYLNNRNKILKEQKSK